MSPCNRHSELQRFHGANANPEGHCCSGIRLWDFGVCLASYQLGGGLNADDCEIFGDAPAQRIKLSGDGLLEWHAGEDQGEQGCIVPAEVPPSSKLHAFRAVLKEGKSCSAKVERRQVNGVMGESTIRVIANDLCLSAAKPAEAGDQLHFRPCAGNGDDGVFRLSHQFPSGYFQVQTLGGLCVDAKHATGPLILWHCDDITISNANQRYLVEDDAAFIWRTGGTGEPYCAEATHSDPVSLVPCAAPEGQVLPSQMFQKSAYEDDGSFELRQMAEGICLDHMPNHQFTEPDEPTHVLASAPCSGSKGQRWSIAFGNRLRNLELSMCIDANDMKAPILYHCYLPDELVSMQRFEHHPNGWIVLPRTWADNGRQRFPATCFDTKPSKPVQLVTKACEEVRQAGTNWEGLWPETPLETRLFVEAEQGH